MSGTLTYYLKMAGIAAVDLMVGFGVAYTTNKWFETNTALDPKASEEERARTQALYAMLQAASTIFLADEIRNLIYPAGMEDPTGGVVYMNAMFHQPILWERILAVFQFLDSYYQKWWGREFNVRVDDRVRPMLSMEDERPADSVRSDLNRLEHVAYRDAHLQPGISVSSLSGGHFEI